MAGDVWDEGYAAVEDDREDEFPAVRLQTRLAWRRLRPLLVGRLRILDAGAGSGRYSLPLALAGHDVVHLDAAPSMIELARGKLRAGSPGPEFVQGCITDLSAFESASFDLVLCFDAPLSFVYPRHEEALDELARVCRGSLAIMTSSRPGMVRDALAWDLDRVYQSPDKPEVPAFFAARAFLADGIVDWTPDQRARLAEWGLDAPRDYGFLPEELEQGLRERGFRTVETAALGALAASVDPDLLAAMLDDPALAEPFLELEEAFGRIPSVRGMGGPNLLCVAEREASAMPIDRPDHPL